MTTNHIEEFIPKSASPNSWIENLALEEINMEESGVVHFNDHLSPATYLDESSIQFMNRLRDLFELYSVKFNDYRGGASGAQIKIFKISNTVNDFMLFRNSLRLVVSRKALDVVSVGFMSTNGAVFSPRLNKETTAEESSHEIRAHIGPFNKITWRFQGELVDIDALVRHYMSEFIRCSAR